MAVISHPLGPSTTARILRPPILGQADSLPESDGQTRHDLLCRMQVGNFILRRERFSPPY